MNLRFYLLLTILLIIRPTYGETNDETSKENDLNTDEDTMVEEELNDEELKKETKIEYLNKVDNCKEKAKTNDFLSLHFTLKWLDNGEKILSTSDRNVPIEIQLGTKMLSAAVDYGLDGICVGEKRIITLPARLGLAGIDYDEKKKDDLVSYELELISISDKMTLATFHYLDLNNDGKVSVQEAEKLIKMFLNSLTTLLPSIDLNQLLSFFLAMHDENGDGKIDMNEFMKSISSFPVKDEL